MSRIRTFTAAATVVAAATAFVAAPATAALARPGKGAVPATATLDKPGKGKSADNRNNNTSEKLRQAASAENALRHVQAFQAIADANGGTRASGTEGYDESVDYVVAQLTAAGYSPTVQEFEFPFFEETAPATLRVGSTVLETGAFVYSGAGELTDGNVIGVDLQLPPGSTANSSTSGCEAADFAGLDLSGSNDVALIQRGTCTFGLKAMNAEEAGAEAVIIFNEGQPGRTDAIIGTLGGPGVTIPVIGASFADAQTILAADSVSLSATTVSEFRTTYNVLAQTSGRTDNVVMVGAHLDSVLDGPGINDNASGSAGILEVAIKMAKVNPTNAVRFAWWGAEELGLLGAEHYVASLTEAELANIALYLNFDMIASPNFVRFVYDGDDSDLEGAGPGPDGSAQIEDVFTGFFNAMGLPSEGTDFSGRSDYGPFIAVGIPAGGLFTGAEGIKTPEQEAVYGGVAGAAYDPCYHEACDSLRQTGLSAEQQAVYDQLRAEFPMVGNINMLVFEQNIDAIAHAVLTYAYSTESVNGVVGHAGKGKTKIKQAPDGGRHGGAGDHSGGGLHDDEGHLVPAA